MIIKVMPLLSLIFTIKYPIYDINRQRLVLCDRVLLEGRGADAED